MIALDTNVLVRIVTNDDAAQVKRAVRLLEKHTVFIQDTALLELVWVLESAYELKRAGIIRALHALLGLPNARVGSLPVLLQAIEHYRQGMDFADALHLAGLPDGVAFYTFDTGFQKKARSLKLKTVLRA
ncbi:MAG TPA: type II toxin-antitoxin system VapC family toxin [Gammaproteobacteria bacterium]|nr:type II toxin-antitoxin system VapC family toxin [Gammaproteobacteria bacterium]